MEEKQQFGGTRKNLSPKCNRCRSHGYIVRRKQHICPYKSCDCNHCTTIGLRAVITRQHKSVITQRTEERNTAAIRYKRSCRKCSNHAQYVSTKYHECPYKECKCECCILTGAYQKNQKRQISMRRQQMKKEYLIKLQQKQMQESETSSKSRSFLENIIAKQPYGVADTGAVLVPDIRFRSPILQTTDIPFRLPVALNVSYQQRAPSLPRPSSLPTYFDQMSQVSLSYSSLVMGPNGSRSHEAGKRSHLQNPTAVASVSPSTSSKSMFPGQYGQNIWAPHYTMMPFQMNRAALSPTRASVFPFNSPQRYNSTNSQYPSPTAFPSIAFQQAARRRAQFSQYPTATGLPMHCNTAAQHWPFFGTNMIQGQQVSALSCPGYTQPSGNPCTELGSPHHHDICKETELCHNSETIDYIGKPNQPHSDISLLGIENNDKRHLFTTANYSRPFLSRDETNGKSDTKDSNLVWNIGNNSFTNIVNSTENNNLTKDLSVTTSGNTEGSGWYPRSLPMSSVSGSSCAENAKPQSCLRYGDTAEFETDLQTLQDSKFDPDHTLNDKAAVNFLYTKLVELGHSRCRNDSEKEFRSPDCEVKCIQQDINGEQEVQESKSELSDVYLDDDKSDDSDDSGDHLSLVI